MKKEKDYIKDIAEIRSMMERSSKFLSLSGWAGIMAGIYALAGAYVAYSFLDFNPDEIFYSTTSAFNFTEVIYVAIAVLLLALGTSIFLSYKKAKQSGEALWNPTAKRLVGNMLLLFLVSVLVILFLLSEELIGLIAPFSLLLYGLALFNASNYTYEEVRVLGLVEIVLGLAACWFLNYSLLLWALGFGLVHIIYGIYMHYKYEK